MKFRSISPPRGIDLNQWHDWQWQLKNALKSPGDFKAYFDLSAEDEEAIIQTQARFRTRVSPYYASLVDPQNPQDPIRKMLMPSLAELSLEGQHMVDPLGENAHRPASRIIHRYQDRALFLVTDFCNVYCRYCTRKHFTAQDQVFPKPADYTAALDYLRAHTEIAEVIVTGGDPLTLSDQRLAQVFTDLREIPHLEILRLATRAPVVSPMRITQDLVMRLKRYQPIFVMTHFNHPNEITASTKEALDLLVDHGFPVMNQLVLLKGVNDHASIIRDLCRKLLYLRVKPYYMFQCDPSEGSAHFRTRIEDSMAIQRELWGHLSGLAMPNLAIDIPGGGGKVGVVPDFGKLQTEQGWTLTGFDGVTENYLY